jgi:hypothetical protein
MTLCWMAKRLNSTASMIILWTSDSPAPAVDASMDLGTISFCPGAYRLPPATKPIAYRKVPRKIR